MNISDIIDSSAILDEAFAHPAMKLRTIRKTGETYKPDMDTALKAVLGTIEEMVINKIGTLARNAMEREALIYAEMMQTDPKSEDLAGQWDELVEEAIKPWTHVLSQDWLGKNLLGVPSDFDGMGLFSFKLGREYFKQMNYGKTPAQIMSSAGVTKASVAERLEVHNNPTQKETDDMATNDNAELDAVVQKIAAHVGKDYDIMAVFGDLDLASDDDDILAQGAAARLGIDEAGIEELRGQRLMHGEDAPDILNKLIMDATQGKKGKKGLFGRPVKEKAPPLKVTVDNGPQPPTVAQKRASAKEKRIADEAAEKEGEIAPEVLEALKDAGCADAEMATAMGVSRATYNNYVNGKSTFSPNADQYSHIRGLVVEKLNALHIALAALDGDEEPHVVF